MKYPCLYKSLKGTSWYNRLIASEFDIRLDGFPEREILIDRTLPDNLKEGALWDRYRSELLTLLDDKRKDDMNPWDFIARFRNARKEIFSSFFIPEPSSGNNDQPRLQTAILDPKIQTMLYTAHKILYIPGSRQSAAGELKLLRQYIQPRQVRVAVSDNPILDLPSPSDLSAGYKDYLSFPLDGIENIPAVSREEKNIICLHTWIMFALLETDSRALNIPDENEWFVRNAIGRAKKSEIRITWPENSGYSRIIESVPDRRETQKRVFESSELLEGLSSSPVQPVKRKQHSKWFTELHGKSPFSCFEQFWIQENKTWNRIESARAGALHCSGLLFSESETEIQPRFFESMVSPMEIKTEELTFMTSFNYFFTDNLKYLYEKDGQSCGHWRNFLLDYLGVQIDGSGDFWETVPLYNKAFLGCHMSGQLSAFHCPEPIISWTGKEKNRDSKRIPVNPEGNPDEAVYTPLYTGSKAGHGHKAALVCHDIVLEYGEGPFEIPPFGVVLVTKTKLTAGQEINWTVTFPEQGEWRWLFGGFNMLAENGINLMKSDSREILETEGWTSQKSKMTQETQLETGTRHPRSVIGKTASGKILLMVLSGRSKLSAGATFEEAAEIALTMTADDPLSFLVNLDGGASASLTAVMGSDRELLSYPAPSENNPVQIPRPVPAILCIREKKQ